MRSALKAAVEDGNGDREPDTHRCESSSGGIDVIEQSLQSAAFFQRCSGVWSQVVLSAARDLLGRIHFGTLVSLDEGNRCTKMVGLVSNAAGVRDKDVRGSRCSRRGL